MFQGRSLWDVLSGLVLPASRADKRVSVVFNACAVILVSSLVLGGGTRGGFLSDVLLELIAVPALGVVLWSLVDLPRQAIERRGRARWELAFCFIMALVPLAQLVPLPPRIWTELPGHGEIATVLDLLRDQQTWMPISVSPEGTWLSLLSLLPPMVIFLGVIQLSYKQRREVSLLFIAVGVVSVFVGLAQLSQGLTSPLRFFTFTNRSEAVGFFANRNHFAALLYTVLLFAAACGDFDGRCRCDCR
jgi:hypothetical protein